MTLVITELRDDFPPGPDPNFNPNLFSEDEDDTTALQNGTTTNHQSASGIGTETAMTKPLNLPQRRLNESAPPIAPMSPRPNRILARHRNSINGNSNSTTGIGMSPLARAESYDDDSSNESPDTGNNNVPSTSTVALLHSSAAQLSNAPVLGKPNRPKNITTTSAGPRPGPSYNGFKHQYSRSSSNSSCQSRHAISPLYCDGSVPTLQSPKNAVAPSDIIFERPPVSATGQTTLMSYSSNADYANNVVQVKNALMPEHMRSNNCHVNPVPLNLNLNLERMDAKSIKPITATTVVASTSATKRKEAMLYIDEETQSPTLVGAASGSSETRMKRTPTVISIAPALPDAITRSCSVGYLDSVVITPSDEALSALRREAPNKRLILIDNRKNRKKRHNHDVSIVIIIYEIFIFLVTYIHPYYEFYLN